MTGQPAARTAGSILPTNRDNHEEKIKPFRSIITAEYLNWNTICAERFQAQVPAS